MDLSLYAYMRAQLRIHMREPVAAKQLTDQEVKESFFLLPSPALTYGAWVVVMQVQEVPVVPEELVLDDPPLPNGTKADLEAMKKDPFLKDIVSIGDPEEKEDPSV